MRWGSSTASTREPPRPACAASPRARRSRRRASARSTPRARSRSRGSAAKRRSPRPRRPARSCATSRAAASRRGGCIPRGARSAPRTCPAHRSSGPTPPPSTSSVRTSGSRASACRPADAKGARVQTPAPFGYERATSVEGALQALQEHGAEARIIAGGHSLLPMMKLRLANPEYLVDINELAELAYIREDAGEIRIGALTRHVDLLKSDLLARRYPLFRDAEEVIADPVVRNRGTIGGSLCQADAAEDLSAVCTAAKAQVVIRGAGGERVVGMESFHIGPYMTAVGAGEMLTEVRLPLRPRAGSALEKVERRAGDWAIAAASAAVWLDGDGTVADAGIALSAVGLTTIHLTRAEELLRGKTPSEELFSQAGEIAS